MQISAVKVDKFKRLPSLEIALSDITVLIGGNNSGKSSLLQGIHLAITTLQSARSATNKAQPASTLGVDQFLYKPSNQPIRLNHNTDMTSKSGPDFTFTYKEAQTGAPKDFGLKMRRGKNANIAITFDHKNAFYERASDRTRPLSIFVPGLAGVALSEERRTDAIVTAGIAQGDANLYLRNVLLRLTLDQQRLDKFHSIIGEVFSDLKVSCDFNEHVHTHIEVLVEIDGNKVPLELVGAGALQAIQLVAYATMYDPGLLLLDEPDAHLHPSNQRLLAATLLKIAEQSSVKIILATHSRHIFDALTRSSMTDVVWLKQGVKQERKESEDLSILLDLGALDSYELLSSNQCRLVVLTEDSKRERLKTILEANGFVKDQYVLQSFDGVSNIAMSATIADFFLKQGNNTHVLIHRDGDCMLPDEVAWYRSRETDKLPDRCELFVTPLTDVEHQFCKPEHLAEALGIRLEEAKTIIDRIISASNASLSIDFANKRTELKNKALKLKENVPSAADLVGALIEFKFVRGKRLFGLLNTELPRLGYNAMHVLSTTNALKIEQLSDFSKRVWPPETKPLNK
jgi:energy-coupling factor transporter ATP-binding protein EcfA2